MNQIQWVVIAHIPNALVHCDFETIAHDLQARARLDVRYDKGRLLCSRPDLTAEETEGFVRRIVRPIVLNNLIVQQGALTRSA